MAEQIVCPSCDTPAAVGTLICKVCRNSLVGVEPTEKQNDQNQEGLSPSLADEEPSVEQSKAGGTRSTDCTHYVRPGETICDWCGQAVSGAGSAQDDRGYRLGLPWGENITITERLFVGRVPPVEETLARRLELDYPNVSRMHAELFVREGSLYVQDYGSLNGTYLNDERIAPHDAVAVPVGSRLRFAANLEMVVSASTEGES